MNLLSEGQKEYQKKTLKVFKFLYKDQVKIAKGEICSFKKSLSPYLEEPRTANHENTQGSFDRHRKAMIIRITKEHG
ncbi:uncharacterized protein G2W53_000883 [Senna tora]|uniref:Uncharacterized protein n=1 Tax=Senna tora TaxID=362788 RepID=A0A834XG76_9FABA|nr:uncharacterized protein G2W53_000883 [Senna tora]